MFYSPDMERCDWSKFTTMVQLPASSKERLPVDYILYIQSQIDGPWVVNLDRFHCNTIINFTIMKQKTITQ